MLSVTFKSQKFATPKISQNSVVGTGWMIRGSNSGRGKRFLSSPKRPNPLWGPTSPLLKGNQGSFQALTRLGREVNHSPPSIAYVKNEWSYTSTSPYISTPRTQTTVPFLTCTYVVTVHNSDAVN